MKLSPVAGEKTMKSAVTIGIYKIDKEQTVDDLVDVFGKDPLGQLYGMEPTVTDYGIYYQNVYTFDTNQENLQVEEIFKYFYDGFDVLKQWF